MYLSMWMLANRLSNYDLDIHIRHDSPAVLRSARLAFATNCVRVYSSGKDCVCVFGEDKIFIRDTDITEAFELVQSVFDFFEEWSRVITEFASAGNFQGMVDRCRQVFNNPILIMDGTCKVLGISSEYAEMDDEWDYLVKYGHSSVKALQYMRHESLEVEYMSAENPAAQPFFFTQEYLNARGITCPIVYSGSMVGRINVFERERKLNTGDMQLLNFIASQLAPTLGISGEGSDVNPNAELLSNLLDGKEVRDDDLERTLSVMHWKKSDMFQVTIINSKNSMKDKTLYYTLISTIYSLLPDSYTITRNGDIVIITRANMPEQQQQEDAMLELCKRNNLHIFRSLPLHGFKNLHYCFRQALFALELGRVDNPHITLCEFYHSAVNYIIMTADLGEILKACHPDIVYLKELQSAANYDMVATLKCYLDNNRSILHTANAMFLHRNSMVYRLARITECLKYDLDDAYNRDYLRLSIRILELCDNSHNRERHELDPNRYSA